MFRAAILFALLMLPGPAAATVQAVNFYYVYGPLRFCGVGFAIDIAAGERIARVVWGDTYPTFDVAGSERYFLDKGADSLVITEAFDKIGDARNRHRIANPILEGLEGYGDELDGTHYFVEADRGERDWSLVFWNPHWTWKDPQPALLRRIDLSDSGLKGCDGPTFANQKGVLDDRPARPR